MRSGDYGDLGSNASAMKSTIPKRPKKPPKLQHVLKDGKAHELVKAGMRDEDTLDAPEFIGSAKDNHSKWENNGQPQGVLLFKYL